MPSDRPPPEPPASDPATRRRQTGAVRDGTLVFALVLGGFVAYALGAHATYRATAIIGVEPVTAASAVALPKQPESVQRLRAAALDPSVVKLVSRDPHLSPPDTDAQAR